MGNDRHDRPRGGFFAPAERGRPRGYTARIWLHGGYTEPQSKTPTPKDWR